VTSTLRERGGSFMASRITFALMLVMASAAQALEGRDRLAAPGPVPFGTTYETAQTMLKPEAVTYNNEQRTKKHSTSKTLSNGQHDYPFGEYSREITYLFHDDRMALAEILLDSNGSALLSECAGSDAESLSELIKRYGEPDAHRTDANEDVRVFEFNDGSRIEYVAEIDPDIDDEDEDIQCTVLVQFIAADAN
jgi:hypothetical protein